MSDPQSVLNALKGVPPLILALAVLGVLAYVIVLMVKQGRQVELIRGNHLHTISETLARIEVLLKESGNAHQRIEFRLDAAADAINRLMGRIGK